MINYDTFSIPLIVAEQAGATRVSEPVAVGIPFPQGTVFDPSRLTLWDTEEQPLPLQTQPLAWWFDGSVKWLLLDFQANVEANTQAAYTLRLSPEPSVTGGLPNLSVQESAGHVIVDTGKATFFLNRNLCKPFDRALIQGTDLIAVEGSSLVLTDE